MLRCLNCKEKVARFPLKDSDGNIIWINLFKMDLMSIIGLAIIIILIMTYKADIKTCEEIITDPLKFCEESNACKIIEERNEMNPYRTVSMEDILELNESG